MSFLFFFFLFFTLFTILLTFSFCFIPTAIANKFNGAFDFWNKTREKLYEKRMEMLKKWKKKKKEKKELQYLIIRRSPKLFHFEISSSCNNTSGQSFSSNFSAFILRKRKNMSLKLIEEKRTVFMNRTNLTDILVFY